MGETIEKVEQELKECRESQNRLLQQVSNLEKQLKALEFHHRSTNQLLLSIVDMDTSSGGDRSSLRRRIKILSYIDDHIHSMGSNISEITLHDILLAFITSPQEFGLPPGGLQFENVFTSSEHDAVNHPLDTQTALILAICISDIFASLFTISDTISLQALHENEKDRLKIRCLAGVSSRLAEESMTQILQGAFFPLLQKQVSLIYNPPNPRQGPGVELEINYNF
jgi:hypothetical protein